MRPASLHNTKKESNPYAKKQNNSNLIFFPFVRQLGPSSKPLLPEGKNLSRKSPSDSQRADHPRSPPSADRCSHHRDVSKNFTYPLGECQRENLTSACERLSLQNKRKKEMRLEARRAQQLLTDDVLEQGCHGCALRPDARNGRVRTTCSRKAVTDAP